MWSAATRAFAGLSALLLLACQGGPAPSAGPSTSEPESGVEASLGNATLQLTVLDQTEHLAGAGVLKQNAPTAGASFRSSWLSVRLDFNRRPGKQGPRVAEILLGHSDNLAFVSAEAQGAVTAAGKELVAQARDGGVVRLVNVGTASLTELESGPLARLDLRKTGTGPATLKVLPEMPIFAPAEANQGLLLPEPLVVGGDR